MYHKSCQREQIAQEKENQAKHNANLSESKLSKIQQTREKATQERSKVSEQWDFLHKYIIFMIYNIFMNYVCVFLQARDRYEKVLEDVTGFAPRYMEEMESVFDQSQEEERKRISFLKQAFLSIHRHLDITNNERFKMATRIWLHYISCHKTIVIGFFGSEYIKAIRSLWREQKQICVSVDFRAVSIEIEI